MRGAAFGPISVAERADALAAKGAQGDDVTVALLDTGITPGADLAGRVVHGAPDPGPGRRQHEQDRLGRRRDAGEGLTPAETRVVELIATGMTNRAVADRLVLSPKTVEAHLARAYAKLGVRSRAELGRHLAAAGLDLGQPRRDRRGRGCIVLVGLG